MNQLTCSTCGGAGGTLVRDKSVPKTEAKYYHQNPVWCKIVERDRYAAEARVKADVVKHEYLDDNGLQRQELFKRLVQSLIELSNGGSEERSLLESLSNHIQAKGATVSDAQLSLFATEGTENSEK